MGVEGGVNMYAFLWLIQVVLWQKPTQHCKAIILQLKINFKKRKEKNKMTAVVARSENLSF